jgi:hypothetical protein
MLAHQRLYSACAERSQTCSPKAGVAMQSMKVFLHSVAMCHISAALASCAIVPKEPLKFRQTARHLAEEIQTAARRSHKGDLTEGEGDRSKSVSVSVSFWT